MKIVITLSFCLLFSVAKDPLFEPLPNKDIKLTPRAKLGKMLFHDPILSKDNTISCAACHPLQNYGVDGLKKPLGINALVGHRNTPTVWNALFNATQHWDGSKKTLKEQALEPILNPVEMNETIPSVIQKLKNSPKYNKTFEHLYDDGVTKTNLADAIAAFERTLITTDSKFDKYLRGDDTALNKEEKRGLALFKSKGCVSCHNGINIGGSLFQKIGIFDEYINTADLGRYNITKKTYDKYYFKVPSLRNIANTAPYFHDGSVATLEDAVKLMVELQLGRTLSHSELKSIIAFLNTLTGEIHD